MDFTQNIERLERVAEDKGYAFYAGAELECNFVPVESVGSIAFGSTPLFNREVTERRHDRDNHVAAALSSAMTVARELSDNSNDYTGSQSETLRDVTSFRLEDALNFAIYQRLSSHRLNNIDFTTATSLSALQKLVNQHSEHDLEFRFGKQTGGVGYYDAAGVSEFRITPCSPHELPEKINTLKTVIGQLATRFGVAVIMPHEHAALHINLSAYSITDGKPLITREGSDETLQIVDGISGAVQSGLSAPCIDKHLLPYLFTAIGPDKKFPAIIHNGRLEFRGGVHNPAQFTNLLLSGALKGLDGDTDLAYTQRSYVQGIRPRDASYKKSDILRKLHFALETSTVDRGGMRSLSPGIFGPENFGNAGDLFNYIFRDNALDIDTATMYAGYILFANNLVFSLIATSTTGELSINARLFEEVTQTLIDQGKVQPDFVEFAFEQKSLKDVVTRLNEYLSNFNHVVTQEVYADSGPTPETISELKTRIKTSVFLGYYLPGDTSANAYIKWLETQHTAHKALVNEAKEKKK